MVMDKKHEPVYCWNSDKTYSILSVNKVLIQVIICLYSVLSYALHTTRQGKVSFQETLNFRTGTVGLSQCFFSITPVFSAEGLPFLFGCFTGAPK